MWIFVGSGQNFESSIAPNLFANLAIVELQNHFLNALADSGSIAAQCLTYLLNIYMNNRR
jgi:hypothetical protein